MKTDVPLQLRYGGVVLLILGPLLALFAGGLYLQSRRAQNWPTVDARVTESKIEVSKKASGFRRSRTSFRDHYTATIQYEYVVDGERFTGNRIAFDASRSSGFDRDVAESWVGRYPVGAAVTIHYSPHRAEQSVIDPSANTVLLSMVAGFGVFAIPAGLMLRRIARQMQPVGTVAAPTSKRAASPVPRGAVASAPLQAVAPAPPPVAVPTEHPVRKKQTGGDKPLSTHWLIRTMAVVTGLVLLLFGSLALPVSVRLHLRGEHPPGQEAVSFAVHLVLIGIMGGVTLLGAFLVWKGMKTKGRFRRFEGCEVEAA